MSESNNHFVILSKGRGDYITGITWQRDGKANITGGSPAEAIRYTPEEAREVLKSLGRGFIAEPVDAFTVNCEQCNTAIDELAVFPGGICVKCHEQRFNALVASNGGVLPRPNFSRLLNRPGAPTRRTST